MATRFSVRVWKCVAPIHDLIVPKGCSTVCRRTRMASGVLVEALFDGHRLDDAGTLAAIKGEYEANGELLDPHSVIGVASGRAKARYPATPMVAMATAHPAKFPDAVERATGGCVSAAIVSRVR